MAGNFTSAVWGLFYVIYYNMKADGFTLDDKRSEIEENGYDLSINKYKKVEYVAVEYPPTSEIIAEIKELQKKISEGIEELEGML